MDDALCNVHDAVYNIHKDGFKKERLNMFCFNKKYNVLILGGNGMLGHELYDRFTQLSLQPTSKIGKVIKLDRSDDFDLSNMSRNDLSTFLFRSIHFDYCINCVAYTDTNAAENTEEGRRLSYELNANALKYIATACKCHKTKLIHISTDYVFSECSSMSSKNTGIFDTVFFTSSNPCPKNIYGMHKLIGELNVQNIFGKDIKDYAILRTSWLYGMHNNKSFIHKFMLNVVKTLKSSKDETPTIDVTQNEYSVPTSCRCIFNTIYQDVILKKRYGIMHAVPETNPLELLISRLDFARQILSYYKEDEYEVDGISLSKVKLNGVDRHTYQPEHSTMFSSNEDELSWKKYLNAFMQKNKDAIFNWALAQCSN